MDELEELLAKDLYKSDLREIAETLGIRDGGGKRHLIPKILSSRDFQPSLALAYLNTTELRRVCGRLQLVKDGDRDALTARVLGALTRRGSNADSTSQPAGSADTHSVQARPSVGRPLHPPVLVPTPHPDPPGPWAVVALVATLGLGVILAGSLPRFGYLVGSLIALGCAIAIGVGLLLTARYWISALSRLTR